MILLEGNAKQAASMSWNAHPMLEALPREESEVGETSQVWIVWHERQDQI